MSRTRMSWDWVGDHPVFVYTRFIDHFKFAVTIKAAPQHRQNDRQQVLIEEYIQEGIASKAGVVDVALEKARVQLGVQKHWKEKLMEGVNVDPEVCPHCGAHADTWDEIKHYDSCNPEAVYEYN